MLRKYKVQVFAVLAVVLIILAARTETPLVYAGLFVIAFVAYWVTALIGIRFGKDSLHKSYTFVNRNLHAICYGFSVSTAAAALNAFNKSMFPTGVLVLIIALLCTLTLCYLLETPKKEIGQALEKIS